MAAGGSLMLFDSQSFDQISADRHTNVSVGDDDSAIVRLTEFKENTVYEEPHEVTVRNETGSALTGNNWVNSVNGRLEFRESDADTASDSMALDSLADGAELSFQVVTATDESGEVSDDIVLDLQEPDELSVQIERNLTVEFKSSGRLVYALDGDIRVYDAVKDEEVAAPESHNADVIGANAVNFTDPTDNADIAYASSGTNGMFTTEVNAVSDNTVRDTSPSDHGINKQKTRFAVDKWPKSSRDEFMIFYADAGNSSIYGMYADGDIEKIATPSNNVAGVSGVTDIDGDGSVEMVFVDGSQQLRYLNTDGSVTGLGNGGIGSNNSAGFGPPADFGKGIEIPFIDGGNNAAVIGSDNKKTTLTSNGPAKKAAVAPVDVDNDDELEFCFLGVDEGKIMYIDDVYGNNSIETLKIGENDTVKSPDESVALNSGVSG